MAACAVPGVSRMTYIVLMFLFSAVSFAALLYWVLYQPAKGGRRGPVWAGPAIIVAYLLWSVAWIAGGQGIHITSGQLLDIVLLRGDGLDARLLGRSYLFSLLFITAMVAPRR